MMKHLEKMAFCKLTSHSPGKIPHPMSYIPNILHPNTPNPQHHLFRTSLIPNTLHLKRPYLTSPIFHVPKTPYPEYPASQTF